MKNLNGRSLVTTGLGLEMHLLPAYSSNAHAILWHALDKLPSIIGCMLTEVPNWFRNSELRREVYKKSFLTMNTVPDSQPTQTALLPFQKASFTRWLVRVKVLYNILMN